MCMMRTMLRVVMAIVACLAMTSCNAKPSGKHENNNEKMKILFINGSPNRDGNTAGLARTLLEGHEYETLNLCDYRIGFYGQDMEGDQFAEVLARMKAADVVVVGSPVYWHNICASVRTVMERFYGHVPEGTFSGKRFFFVYQGAAPTKMMIDDGEYTASRFAGMYGFSYEGMATNEAQARELRDKLR